MNLLEKVALIFLLIYYEGVVFTLSAATKTKVSLFDELPLNGALASSPTRNYLVGLLQSPETTVRSVSSTSIKKGGTSEHGQQEESSLFDELPNQGALQSSTSTLTRNTRDSLFTLEAGGSVEYDIHKSKPSSEFNLAFLENALIPQVVNSIAKNTHQITIPVATDVHVPILTPSVFQQPSTSYGIPRVPLKGGDNHQYQYFHQRQPQRTQSWLPQRLQTSYLPPRVQPKHQVPDRFNRSFHHVSANAAGPTVIVYANPDGSRTHKPHPLKESEKTDPKNEIHYHYHINQNDKEEGRHKPKPTQAPSSGWSNQNNMQRHHGSRPTKAPSNGWSNHSNMQRHQRPRPTKAPSNGWSNQRNMRRHHRPRPTEGPSHGWSNNQSSGRRRPYSRRRHNRPNRPGHGHSGHNHGGGMGHQHGGSGHQHGGSGHQHGGSGHQHGGMGHGHGHHGWNSSSASGGDGDNGGGNNSGEDNNNGGDGEEPGPDPGPDPGPGPDNEGPDGGDNGGNEGPDEGGNSGEDGGETDGGDNNGSGGNESGGNGGNGSNGNGGNGGNGSNGNGGNGGNGSNGNGGNGNESNGNGGNGNGSNGNGGNGNGSNGNGGNGGNGSGGNGNGPYPPSSGFRNGFRRGFVEDDSSSSSEEEIEDFSTRQLFTNHKKRKTLADSISLTYERPPPADAPAPPPAYGPPSPTYGPPSPTYGPPPPAGPPAPPPQSDQPEDKYHTTITLQTIPITKQVTEFVQVPNIVHQISSSAPADSPLQDDDSDLQPPPHHGGYGSPPSKANKRPLKHQQKNQNPTGFQSHLSKFLASTGIDNQANLLGQNRNRLAELELLELLGSGSSGRLQNTPILTPGNLANSQFSSGLFSASRGPLTNFRQGFHPVSSGSTDEGLREIIREQRYQNILTDLRSRLREESRSADRARSDYKGLFSKGALLLSALTLLPSIVSPFTAATAAAGGASSLTNYMLPLIPATGRRRKRRSAMLAEESVIDPRFNEFEKCLSSSTHEMYESSRESNHTTSEMTWLNCAHTLESMEKCVTTTGSTPGVTPSADNSDGNVVDNCTPDKFRFASHSMMSQIRLELSKYLGFEFLIRTSRCLQHELCENMEQVEKIGNEISQPKLLESYLNSFGSTGHNPWIHQVLDAFNREKCDDFACPSVSGNHD